MWMNRPTRQPKKEKNIESYRYYQYGDPRRDRHPVGMSAAATISAGLRRSQALQRIENRLADTVTQMAVSGRVRCRHRQDRLRQLQRTLGRAGRFGQVPASLRGGKLLALTVPPFQWLFLMKIELPYGLCRLLSRTTF